MPRTELQRFRRYLRRAAAGLAWLVEVAEVDTEEAVRVVAVAVTVVTETRQIARWIGSTGWNGAGHGAALC